jgi:hypothetical protein
VFAAREITTRQTGAAASVPCASQLARLRFQPPLDIGGSVPELTTDLARRVPDSPVPPGVQGSDRHTEVLSQTRAQELLTSPATPR